MLESRLLTSAFAVAMALTGCTLDSQQPLMPTHGGGGGQPSQVGPWSVSLQTLGGAPLPHYTHGGATFIEGVQGQPYAIRVSNPTPRRVEAVVTVDGRDVISGELGDFARQRGYIIEPHDHVIVQGFRQSMSQVATFRFTTPGDSYAGRRGHPGHVGVIGVALFPERAPQPMAAVRRRADKSHFEMDEEAPAAAPMDSGEMGDDLARGRRHNLGTQYGEGRHDQVVEVPFTRADASRPEAVLAVYYDNAEGLASRGIDVPRRPTAFAPPPSGEPSPFPGR